MLTEKRDSFSGTYSTWLGKPVVLLVEIRRCHVPVPCMILGESLAHVRVRFDSGLEMDVRKELILAVEEMANTSNPLVH